LPTDNCADLIHIAVASAAQLLALSLQDVQAQNPTSIPYLTCTVTQESYYMHPVLSCPKYTLVWQVW